MIQYICDICGNPTNEICEVTVRELVTDDPTVTTNHICKECLAKFRDYRKELSSEREEDMENDDRPDENASTKDVLDETLEEEKVPKSYDCSQDYRNVPLRDFLSSPFYLKSNKVFLFKTTDNQLIQNYEPWMSHEILTVHPPTAAHSEVIVTLL